MWCSRWRTILWQPYIPTVAVPGKKMWEAVIGDIYYAILNDFQPQEGKHG